MKRTLIAAAWIAGSTIPLLMATVFVFGCCVLPFHGVIHRVMPLCHIAAELMTGHHGAHDGQTPMPAREKQEPPKRFVTEAPPLAAALAGLEKRELGLPRSKGTAYRSFISLGATRCDRDVGLRVLIDSFLI